MKSRMSSWASFFTLGGMSPSTCQEEQGQAECARANCRVRGIRRGSHSPDYGLVFTVSFLPKASCSLDSGA